MSEPVAAELSPAQIEARQDELLRQLDELDKRIERVIAEYTAAKQPPRPQLAALPIAVVDMPVTAAPVAR